MTIKVGDRIPDVQLTLATPEGPMPVKTGDYFAGKKVALFAVPGAYTPTCSARHLPSYVEKAGDLKAKGVKFTREPTTVRPGTRVCFIEGPQGVSIELLDRTV